MQGFWPELGEALKAHGGHNYSIGLLPSTRQLFAYVEIEEEARWADVANEPIMKKWWAWMAEFVEFGPDNKPGSTPLTTMFFLQ